MDSSNHEQVIDRIKLIFNKKKELGLYLNMVLEEDYYFKDFNAEQRKQLIISGSMNEQANNYEEFLKFLNEKDSLLTVSTVHVSVAPGVGCKFTTLYDIKSKLTEKLNINNRNDEILVLIYVKPYEFLYDILDLYNNCKSRWEDKVKIAIITNDENTESINELEDNKFFDYYTTKELEMDNKFSFGSNNQVIIVDKSGIVRYLAKRFSNNLENMIEMLINYDYIPNLEFKNNCDSRLKYDSKIDILKENKDIIKSIKSVRLQFNFKTRFDIEDDFINPKTDVKLYFQGKEVYHNRDNIDSLMKLLKDQILHDVEKDKLGVFKFSYVQTNPGKIKIGISCFKCKKKISSSDSKYICIICQEFDLDNFTWCNECINDSSIDYHHHYLLYIPANSDNCVDDIINLDDKPTSQSDAYVRCNKCDEEIEGHFYECGICMIKLGTFNLCCSCFLTTKDEKDDSGHQYSSHPMARQNIKNIYLRKAGELIN